MRKQHFGVRGGALALLALLALAGCGGSDNKASSGAAASSEFADSSGPAAAAAPAAGSAAKAAAPAASTATPVQQRDIVRTATMDLTVREVDQAAAQAIAAATAAGGRADTDDRTSGDGGRVAHLVLRVPPAKLTPLMATMDRLGHETDRTDHGEDVTSSRADVGSRVQTLTTSVLRLRALLKDSGSISDLVALESQLTTRESELESTVAQQRALADQVSLASLTVEFSSIAPPAARHVGTGPSGFGSALSGGLHALLLVLRWLGALAGYLLPFVIALAVIGVIAVPVWRRRRRTVITVAEPVS